MVFDSVIIVDSTKSIISLGVSWNISPICLIISSDPLKLESSSFIIRAPFHSRTILLWSPAIFFRSLAILFPFTCNKFCIPTHIIYVTLKFIYKQPNINEMMQANSSMKDSLLSDLHDGELFKSHPLFLKEMHAIQNSAFFFNDDFEIANPLGRKCGIHKLGTTNFTLQRFHPKYNSSLHNIHLVCLFLAQVIKT